MVEEAVAVAVRLAHSFTISGTFDIDAGWVTYSGWLCGRCRSRCDHHLLACDGDHELNMIMSLCSILVIDAGSSVR